MKKFSFWTRSLLLLCFIVFCSSNGWADNAIHGSWSSYNTREYFSDNKVSVTLAADTDYWFYFWDSNSPDDKFCNSGTMSSTYCSEWKFTKTEKTYCGIRTKAAGTYVFSVVWKEESGTWYPYLSVTYPSSTTETYNIVIDDIAQTQNTTGSFVVDLTSKDSDSQVYFKINDEDYKLATAASITTNGTTNYTAGTSGTASLTLAKGLMYYFTVKSDGSVTVKAVNPDVTVENENSYYLIGNFMNTDGDNINRTNLIFRFNQTGAKTYAFDVPATLEVKSQIYSISAEGVKTIYGPASNTKFDIYNNSYADYDLTAYDLADENSKHFIADDRTLDSDGMYTYTLKVDDEGTPISVNVKHTQLTRVAYFLPDAPDATAQPAYSTRNNASSSGNNKYFGSVNLQENQKCFVISNIRQQADDTYHHGLRFTQNKLYKQGNGGFDVINGKNDGDIDIHKVYPEWADDDKTVFADGFTFGGQAGAYTLEYNPSVGKEDVVNVSENALIGGEVKHAGYGDLPVAINSINIVGTGITGSFDLSTKVPMTYNQTLKCYEYTFDSTSDERTSNLFRFVANDSWAINWGEESTSVDDHAKVPYQGEGPGHTAMPDDPNVLKQYSSWTEGTDLDIIFNRPAGHWTIRFYIVTESTSGGNGYTNKYYYTINGSPLSPYDLSIYGGRVLCSFSSNKDLEIPTGYRAYVAHSFDQKPAESDNTHDGTVSLYRIKYIPANVGVILYGENVAINGTTVTVPFLDYTGDQLTGENLWYNNHNGEVFNNYLVAAPNGCTLSENGKLDEDWLNKGKYYYLARYFAFTWFSKTKNGKLYAWTEPENDAPKQGTLNSGAATAAGLNLPAEITDYASFFRAKGTVGKNRAYLSLPEEVMNYNGQALVQNQDEEDGHLFAKTSLRFDDFFYEDDFNEGEVTDVNSVKNASKTTKDNAYYNLLGMKVSNPTKGLYIINGKKVIIK